MRPRTRRGRREKKYEKWRRRDLHGWKMSTSLLLYKIFRHMLRTSCWTGSLVGQAVRLAVCTQRTLADCLSHGTLRRMSYECRVKVNTPPAATSTVFHASTSNPLDETCTVRLKWTVDNLKAFGTFKNESKQTLRNISRKKNRLILSAGYFLLLLFLPLFGCPLLVIKSLVWIQSDYCRSIVTLEFFPACSAIVST